MRLILVRHVETKANSEKKYIGHTRSEYTEKGKKQIDNISKLISKERVDMIYSSPLPRALGVAKVLSQGLEGKVVIEDSLIEMNFGIFEGKTYQEAQSEFKDEWERWTADYINYRIPNGESTMDVYRRVTNFIDSLKKIDRTNLLVTHGGIIHTIITYLLDLNTDARWHFKIPPGAIVEIEYENYYGIITKLIDNSY